MSNMKKIYLLLLLSLLVLISSCSWDVLSSNVEEINGGNHATSAVEVFIGDAPRNLRASKSASTSTISLSFTSVAGADYYNIYRSIVPRSTDVAGIEDIESLDWTRVGYIEDTGARQCSYTDTINSSIDKNSVKFLYRVQAGSSFTDTFYPTTGAVSDIAEGYTLAPPLSINATKGNYVDRIEVVWTQIEGANGYNLYYTNEYALDDINDWTLYQSNIPYRVGAENIGVTFRPSTTELGRTLYFAVRAIGSSDLSERSSKSSGYTFVEGAPEEPKNATATQYDYVNKIVLSWDSFGDDVELDTPDLEKQYTWTIMRSSGTGDEIELVSFLSANRDNIDGLTYDDVTGQYTYEDTKELQPNTAYTYSIYASCLVEIDGERVLTSGKANQYDIIGTILSAPTDMSLTVDYSTDIFTLTINAPEGYDSSKNWSYIVRGRRNVVLDTQAGAWKILFYGDPVTETVTYTSDFNTDECNEFEVAVFNNELGDLTPSAYSSTVTVSNMQVAPDFSVTQNYRTSDMAMNSYGIYPAFISFEADDRYIGYEVAGYSNGSYLDEFRGSASDFNGMINLAEKGLDTTEIFETLQIRVRGVDKYGSYSQWSDFKDAYGAVSLNIFIKSFEAYCLKPWEFVNLQGYLTETQKAKWNSSEIKSKIDKGNSSSLSEQMDALTGGSWIYTATDYHDGRVGYNAAMDGLGGDILFSFENAGEHQSIYANGDYRMDVNASGSGSASGSIEVSGMYRATVTVPSSVTSKAFSGSYSVVQHYQNGDITETVAATSN